MKIIVFKNSVDRPHRLNVNKPMIAIVGATFALLLCLFGGFGFWFANVLNSGSEDTANTVELTSVKSIVELQQQEIQAIKTKNKHHLDALALKMGDLQARATRVEALGDRLTKLGSLDDGEFNFDQNPPIGGPSEPNAISDIGRLDLDLELLDLEQRLLSQQEQLSLLESLISNRELDSRMEPAGRPIESGWLSSHYGKRADPFTGESSMHSGIDFAGKLKSPVIAVADGVVTWSGRRVGYGNMVDIDHGNGYVTRYAHNHENLVKVGQRVSVGERIALMGTSGRATSPHVHFEVWLNTKRINPTNIVKKLGG